MDSIASANWTSSDVSSKFITDGMVGKRGVDWLLFKVELFPIELE